MSHLTRFSPLALSCLLATAPASAVELTAKQAAAMKVIMFHVKREGIAKAKELGKEDLAADLARGVTPLPDGILENVWPYRFTYTRKYMEYAYSFDYEPSLTPSQSAISPEEKRRLVNLRSSDFVVAFMKQANDRFGGECPYTEAVGLSKEDCAVLGDQLKSTLGGLAVRWTWMLPWADRGLEKLIETQYRIVSDLLDNHLTYINDAEWSDPIERPILNGLFKLQAKLRKNDNDVVSARDVLKGIEPS